MTTWVCSCGSSASAPANAPCCGVAVGGRDHILSLLLDDLAVIATTHQPSPAPSNRTSNAQPRACARPRSTHAATDPRRPHDRHRLRGTERHIDPTAPGAVRAGRSQPPARRGVPALHQRNEVGAIDGAAGSIPRRASVSGSVSQRPGLRQLPVGHQVLVALLRGDRLPIEVARVSTTAPGADARSAHHNK